MGRLEGKRAMVLGADPVALAIAARYVEEGAQVTVAATKEALTTATVPAGAEFLEIKIPPSENDKANIASAAGDQLEILVLGGEDVPAEDDWASISQITPERLEASGNRLILPALTAVQACEKALKAAAHGSIIFLYAPWGWYSDAGWGESSIAYHARHGLMRAIGGEWGPARANMLVTLADTPGVSAFRERNPKEFESRVRMTAMRRIGDLDRDIGGAAVFLGSDDTRFVNGMVVHADGGAHLTAPIIETRIERAE